MQRAGRRRLPPRAKRLGNRRCASRLGELLLREGMVTAGDLSNALAAQSAGSEWRLGRLLVLQGTLDHRSLAQVIAKQFHVAVADPRQTPPEGAALRVLAHEPALQLQGLPLRFEGDRVVVAVSDPPTTNCALRWNDQPECR